MLGGGYGHLLDRTPYRTPYPVPRTVLRTFHLCRGAEPPANGSTRAGAGLLKDPAKSCESFAGFRRRGVLLLKVGGCEHGNGGAAGAAGAANYSEPLLQNLYLLRHLKRFR